jgi:hypothetical protein
MPENEKKPDKWSTRISTLSLVISLFGAAFSFYTWRESQRQTKRSTAMDLSLKILTDPAITDLSLKGDQFITGNADLTHFSAALTLTSFYDYVSYLMNTRQIDEDYVAPSVKCRIVSWDANVLIFRTGLKPEAKDIAIRITKYGPEALAYYERHKEHLPCP